MAEPTGRWVPAEQLAVAYSVAANQQGVQAAAVAAAAAAASAGLPTPPPLTPVAYPIYQAGPLTDQLIAEMQGAAAVTAELRSRLQALVQRLVNAHLAYTGLLNESLPRNARDQFLQMLTDGIAGLAHDLRHVTWEALSGALLAGHTTAMSYIQGGAHHLDPAYGSLQWLAQVVDTTQARLDAQLLSARANADLLLPMDIRMSDLMNVLAPLNQSLTSLDRDIRWATNAAYNQASRDLADRLGVPRMWVAERDACLHCLALSGQIAQPGGSYDSRLTFYVGPSGEYKPLSVYPAGPLWGPPRHPNCRCFQMPVPDISGYPVMPWEAGPTHPSEALRREARRSVLKGMSGSDSLPSRLRAVSALLAIGAGLPKSVEAKARAATRAGRFS